LTIDAPTTINDFHRELRGSVEVIPGPPENPTYPGTDRTEAQECDVEAPSHVLRRAVGPVRRDVIRRQLDAQPPLALDDDAVPVVVPVHLPVQQPRPEGALGLPVGGVEHDDRP